MKLVNALKLIRQDIDNKIYIKVTDYLYYFYDVGDKSEALNFSGYMKNRILHEIS